MRNTKPATAAEWEAERRRQRDVIRATYSASRMNNTKWAEAVGCMKGLVHEYRLKIVNMDEPTEWGWLINWNPDHPNYVEQSDWGPTLVVNIEWMEVQPLQPEELENRLQALSVPYEWHGEVLRIRGYVR